MNELTAVAKGENFRKAMIKNLSNIPQDKPLMIKNVFDGLQKEIHESARAKGFYSKDGSVDVPKNLALIHSEISEALEADRQPKPLPDKNCPDFSNFEIELADAVIRILDLAEDKRFSLGAAMLAKIKANANRPHKHGKRY